MFFTWISLILDFWVITHTHTHTYTHTRTGPWVCRCQDSMCVRPSWWRWGTSKKCRDFPTSTRISWPWLPPHVSASGSVFVWMGGGGHCLLCTCLLAGTIRLHTVFGVYIGLVQVVPMYQPQYKQSSNNRLCCKLQAIYVHVHKFPSWLTCTINDWNVVWSV